MSEIREPSTSGSHESSDWASTATLSVFDLRVGTCRSTGITHLRQPLQRQRRAKEFYRDKALRRCLCYRSMSRKRDMNRKDKHMAPLEYLAFKSAPIPHHAARIASFDSIAALDSEPLSGSLLFSAMSASSSSFVIGSWEGEMVHVLLEQETKTVYSVMLRMSNDILRYMLFYSIRYFKRSSGPRHIFHANELCAKFRKTQLYFHGCLY